jgi:DNA-binding MarR family transcriptional regulator
MAGQKTNEIDNYALQVILTILHIIGNIRHSGMEASLEVELSYPQIIILYTLLEKEEATMTELSDSLKVTQGVVSRMVDRLEEKKLVERNREREDRRVVTVRLSLEGRRHALRMIDFHLDSLKKHLLEISGKDREVFLDVLRSIDGKLEADREGKNG